MRCLLRGTQAFPREELMPISDAIRFNTHIPSHPQPTGTGGADERRGEAGGRDRQAEGRDRQGEGRCL